MNHMSKRKGLYIGKRDGAKPSEIEHESLSSFPFGQSSNILPVLDRSNLSFDNIVSRAGQPIREKLLRD